MRYNETTSFTDGGNDIYNCAECSDNCTWMMLIATLARFKITEYGQQHPGNPQWRHEFETCIHVHVTEVNFSVV